MPFPSLISVKKVRTTSRFEPDVELKVLLQGNTFSDYGELLREQDEVYVEGEVDQF